MRILLVTDRFSVGALDLAAYYESPAKNTVDCVLSSQLSKCKDNYDIVGLSFFGFDDTGMKVPLDQLVTRLRALRARFPKSKLWLGGRALSLFPESMVYVLKKECDFVCVGPGEFMLTVGVDKIDFAHYPSWTEKHVRQLKATDKNPTVVTVQSSRGCPYSCAFCHAPERVSFFPAERTAKNVKLVNDIIQFPMICDDIFTLRASHMVAVRRAMDKLQVPYKNKIRFFTHAKHRNEAEIGLFEPLEVQIGLESGDDVMLKRMNKGVTVAENYEAVRRLGSAVPGRLVGLFMIGFPGETEDSLKRTLDFVSKTKQYYKKIWISYFIPVPGTPAMTMASAQGEFVDSEVSNREIGYISKDVTEDMLRKYRNLIARASQ